MVRVRVSVSPAVPAAPRLVPTQYGDCRRTGVVTVTALSLGVLGRNRHTLEPSWCWVDPDAGPASTLWWQYFTGKAWEIACYVVIFVLYVPVKCKLQKQVRARRKV